MKDEIKEMPQIDATLEYSLEDFMEAYKIIDEDKVYSNGIEYVPIFRVKQWLDYNNITDLQEERDMFERMSNWACKNMFAYKSRIDKANNILKDTSVDMPSTLLIETIYYAIHILNSGDDNE